jgi:hypothetical protein
MNAPCTVIVVPLPLAGSPKFARYQKPPAYPMQPRDRQWLKQGIPSGPTRRELVQEVQRALAESKPHIEALRDDGRRMLDDAR